MITDQAASLKLGGIANIDMRRREQMHLTAYNIKSVTLCLVLLIVILCSGIVSADVTPQVKTDKDTYNAGETIQVNFFNAPGYNRDWICIVSAESRDDDAGDYKNMPHGLNQGVLTFDVPSTPGKYEVRAYYNYSRNGYVVSARYPFYVGVAAPAAGQKMVGLPEVIPAPSPVYSTASGDTPISIAILYFTPLSMDAAHYGITVTNTLRDHPKIKSTFIVLGRKDLEMFLTENNLQQNDHMDNMIEIGTRLGLNYVIAGNITKRGSTLVTKYKIANVTQRNIIYTNQFMAAGETDLISHVMKMGDNIINAILRGAN